MAKTTYNTLSRQALLEFFRANPDRQFTADMLCEALSGGRDGAGIARSTLYRQLSTLCEAGLIQKFDGTDPATKSPVRYYQACGAERECAHHFHLKCLRCGELQHLECDRTAHLLGHILDEHQFRVDCGKSILFGLCTECAQKEDEHRGTFA